MAESNTKGRLLFLEHYLLENTDEEHPVTAEQLMQAYEDNGYKANRNTIRDDISVLQTFGIDVIIDQHGKYKTFYIGNRLFEPAEVKTLADAVAGSRFITKEKSEALITKLSELTNKHNRQRITRHAISANRIKTVSPGIFHSIDKITAAIDEEKKISFRYIDYLPTKEVVLRHDGKVYVVSPQALVWNDDRYYVPAYSEEKGCVIPFRIDRMRDVNILEESAYIEKDFNVAEYSKKAVLMFDDNEEEREVTLVAENEFMLNIIDRFGEDVQTEIIDDAHFTANVYVRPNATFFAWIFQFRGGIFIKEPREIADNYKNMLERAVESQCSNNIQ